MHYTDLHYRIALTLLRGIGPKKARHLLASCPDISSIFQEDYTRLHASSGISLRILKDMNRKEALAEAVKQAQVHEKKGVKSLFYHDPDYPRRLKQCPDAPLMLYYTGNFSVNHARILAIVGTREATSYGKRLCDELVADLRGKNVLVVSGLAYGIDIHVHEQCVAHGIPTVGVLGHGLDRVYPALHRKTALSMCENGGMLTEYLPGTKPDREHFPMRNRIVAGMADATVVIESRKSGGSLITAKLANDYNRDVFAYPGNAGRLLSEGCNRLIQDQLAHLITGSADLFRWMNWEEPTTQVVPQKKLFHEHSPEERAILEQLTVEGDQHVDLIAHRQQQKPGALNLLLLKLEMDGVIKCLPGKRYRIA